MMVSNSGLFYVVFGNNMPFMSLPASALLILRVQGWSNRETLTSSSTGFIVSEKIRAVDLLDQI